MYLCISVCVPVCAYVCVCVSVCVCVCVCPRTRKHSEDILVLLLLPQVYVHVLKRLCPPQYSLPHSPHFSLSFSPLSLSNSLPPQPISMKALWL